MGVSLGTRGVEGTESWSREREADLVFTRVLVYQKKRIGQTVVAPWVIFDKLVAYLCN